MVTDETFRRFVFTWIKEENDERELAEMSCRVEKKGKEQE
jgi:hypothetical protein